LAALSYGRNIIVTGTNLMEGGVRAGAVIELVQRPPQIRIDFLVSGLSGEAIKT